MDEKTFSFLNSKDCDDAIIFLKSISDFDDNVASSSMALLLEKAKNRLSKSFNLINSNSLVGKTKKDTYLESYNKLCKETEDELVKIACMKKKSFFKNSKDPNLCFHQNNNESGATLENKMDFLRDDCGSWIYQPVMVRDPYEETIFYAHIEYWRRRKNSKKVLSFHEIAQLSKKPGHVIISSNLNLAARHCSVVRDAIRKVKKVEEEFKALPRDIILDIINNGKADNIPISSEQCLKLKNPPAKRVSRDRFPHQHYFDKIAKMHRRDSIDFPSYASACDSDSDGLKYITGCECKVQDKPGLHIKEAKLLKSDSIKNGKLKLWMGGYAIPRNDKRKFGGEDGWFLSEELQSMGVADGVSEWENLCGVSAKKFANYLMKESLNIIKKSSVSNETPEIVPSDLARKVMIDTFNNSLDSTVHGASTALIMVFDDNRDIAGFANLGDSGALVLRRVNFDSGTLHSVRRVKEMQHEFNCPFQLAKLPDENDWNDLILAGYSDIVEIAQKHKNEDKDGPLNSLLCDNPTETETMDVKVEEGDLIVIGTDGLFDNLFDEEIGAITGQSFTPIEAKEHFNDIRKVTTPMALAKVIAISAYYRSLDPNSKTPFSVNANKHYNTSSQYLGGKEDDITVLVAWVVKETEIPLLTSKNIPYYQSVNQSIPPICEKESASQVMNDHWNSNEVFIN